MTKRQRLFQKWCSFTEMQLAKIQLESESTGLPEADIIRRAVDVYFRVLPPGVIGKQGRINKGKRLIPGEDIDE